MKKLLLICLFTIALPAASYGQTTKFIHEVALTHTRGAFSFTDSTVEMGLGLGYFNLTWEQIQLGVEGSVDWNHLSGVGGGTGIMIKAIGLAVYNTTRMGNLEDAAFIGAGFGFAIIGPANQDADANLSFKLIAGKRFPLYEHINFRPHASVEKTGGIPLTVTLMPVAFSINFSEWPI